MTTHSPFNWKIFWILAAALAVGLVAVLPYSLALQGGLPASAANLPMPLPLLITIQLGSQWLLFILLAGVGLLLAGRIGLGLPILDAALRGEPVGERLRRILPISVVLGVLAALAIIALDVYVFQPALKAQFGHAVLGLAGPHTPAAWQGLLASFYGGIDEEVLLRLFVMTLLAWLGHFISRTPEGRPTVAVLWIANILAAVLFGLGHLPVTAALVPITPLVVLRAIVLNGLGGMAFGYLYMTRGLESAMLSHFSADLVLHVLFAI